MLLFDSTGKSMSPEVIFFLGLLGLALDVINLFSQAKRDGKDKRELSIVESVMVIKS